MAWGVYSRRITEIRPHTNADALELAFIGTWQLVVPKGVYSKDQLVVYFPSDSLIPEKHLEEWGLLGKLAGSQKNRVKAIRLRGEISIGIISEAPSDITEEGVDLAERYGVTRWEEPIPVQLAGKIRPKPPEFVKYDLDNFRNHVHPFEDGEPVAVTEKIHGTNASFILTESDEFVVCSRNLAIQEDDKNAYWRVAKKYRIEKILRKLRDDYFRDMGVNFVCIHGEIYGVQDLRYGVLNGDVEFAAFDVRTNHGYLSPKDFAYLIPVSWLLELHNDDEDITAVDIPRINSVPVLYTGPYSRETIEALVEGKEQVSGKELHMREGIVIKPLYDAQAWRYLKLVSNEYLLRKGGTEFH